MLLEPKWFHQRAMKRGNDILRLWHVYENTFPHFLCQPRWQKVEYNRTRSSRNKMITDLRSNSPVPCVTRMILGVRAACPDCQLQQRYDYFSKAATPFSSVDLDEKNQLLGGGRLDDSKVVRSSVCRGKCWAVGN